MLRRFVITCLIVTLWINLSEVPRYFLIVMPMTRQTLAMVPGVAPMSWPIFAIWGLWDTILTIAVVWIAQLHFERFGGAFRAAVLAGTLCWGLLFLLFWIAMLNMALAAPTTALIALPWAWIEMVVACQIAFWCFKRLPLNKPASSA